MAGAAWRVALRNVKNAEGLPLTSDAVIVPLSRAKAAVWLLAGMEFQYVGPPEEHAAWLRDICYRVIGDSIAESEQAYAKKYGTTGEPEGGA